MARGSSLQVPVDSRGRMRLIALSLAASSVSLKHLQATRQAWTGSIVGLDRWSSRLRAQAVQGCVKGTDRREPDSTETDSGAQLF